jgi:hypothetical protein
VALLRLIVVLAACVVAGSVVLALFGTLIGAGAVALFSISLPVIAIAAALNEAITDPRERPQGPAARTTRAAATSKSTESARARTHCNECGAETTGLRRCRRCAASV